ncbi:MAG: hypothetical protein HC871_07035 [Rhizobiales bacterium]|nr:hypothetical protein [Hyphomicrobiales bacterium]
MPELSTVTAFALSVPFIVWMVVWGLAGLGLCLLARRPRMARGGGARRREGIPGGTCRSRDGHGIDRDDPGLLGL